jgi:hypothetical protein
VQKEKQGEAQKSFIRECRAKSMTKLQKVVPKGVHRKFFCSKVISKGMQSQKYDEAAKKSFLRERRVSFLLKSRFKGNAEPNTTEIEGEEVQKSFLRGCRT